MSNPARFETSLPNDPAAMRHVNTPAVEALDRVLAGSFAGAEVMHAIDPSRVVSFAAGGPPLWSVAFATDGRGLFQYLSYGLSRGVDPASPFGFELALRVRSTEPAPIWPTLLLRHVARYLVSSGREVKAGQSLALYGPISRAPVAPHEQHLMPDTRMTSVMLLAGPTLPTPAGAIEVRSVFGLDASEVQWLELCQSATFARLVQEHDPSLAVDLTSPSLVHSESFLASVGAASKSEGSDGGALCIEGLHWSDDGSALHVQLPRGSGGFLKKRLASRLPFGRQLFLHAANAGPGTEVVIVPGNSLDILSSDDPVRLVLQMPPTSTQFQFLSDADAANWSFRYA